MNSGQPGDLIIAKTFICLVVRKKLLFVMINGVHKWTLMQAMIDKDSHTIFTHLGMT